MLNRKQNLIFWTSLMLVGVGLVFYRYFWGLPQGEETTVSGTPEAGLMADFTPLPTFQPLVQESLTPEPFLGLNGIKASATCQVNGEISFFSPDTFSSVNSQISWQNVDSQGRLINWRVDPADSLFVGPNIFANLDVPEGQYGNLTIRLPEEPVAKKYLLTASITYGQIIQGDVKVKEVNCTGQVKVNLDF